MHLLIPIMMQLGREINARYYSTLYRFIWRRGDNKPWHHSTTNMPSRIIFIQNESSAEINKIRTNHVSIFPPNIRCFGMFSTKRSSIYHWSKQHPTTWFPTQHNLWSLSMVAQKNANAVQRLHLWFEHNIAYSLQQQLLIQSNNEISTHWRSWVWKIMKKNTVHHEAINLVHNINHYSYNNCY